tara:strand:+ start:81 stop:521 length:441 start_codon:yes stop_codon:yes gene_type:complete
MKLIFICLLYTKMVKMNTESFFLVLITILVVIVLVLVYNKRNSETFINQRAVGQSFAEYHSPHPPSCQLNVVPNPNACTPENNCFPGAQLRTQVYQNLCNDPSSGINKLPVQIGDTCLRTHNQNIAPDLLNLKCSLNNGGQLNCKY